MADTIIIETPVATVLEVTGLQGPQGVPGASQADVLTTQGDLLYRGASAAARLGIGTAGQILKVNTGGTAPEWGAAPAAGVSSVNGDTGAVSVTPASIDAAEANHDHQPSDIYSDAVKVTATTLSAGEPNGVYFRNGSDNGKATYNSAAGYLIYWDDAEGEWVIGNVSQSHKYFIGSQDTTYPWQVSIAWTLGAQGSGTVPTVVQSTLNDYQLNAAQDAVSTRVPKSGNATSTQVVLGSDTRLSDSRTPTAHTHELASLASTGADEGELPVAQGDGTVAWQNGTAWAGLNITAVDVGAATASHSHGNLTSAGAIGSTAGLPVVTTTAGAITTLALGSANQVLKVNSGGTAVEFGAAAASGATNIWIPASAWIPRTTTGCGVDSREQATNKVNTDELLFDTATEEYAQAMVVMPSNYNNSTVTALFYWTAASGSGGVAWGLRGRAYADDDALDAAQGTGQVVTDTFIAANDMHVTSATSAITLAGTPAANRPIQYEIYRSVANASDTLAVDARLLGVEIIFN